jgi:hypothetical protein
MVNVLRFRGGNDLSSLVDEAGSHHAAPGDSFIAAKEVVSEEAEREPVNTAGAEK